MRFREFMAADDRPQQPQRRPGGMTMGQLISGKEEYKQGVEDARRGTYRVPKHYGGSQLSGSKRGAYIDGWLEAGGDAKVLSPLDWIHAFGPEAKYRHPDADKSEWKHAKKFPHMTDDEIRQYAARFAPPSQSGEDQEMHQRWAAQQVKEDEHRLLSLRKRVYGH